MFALVDGNNFYVCCERVFRPSPLGRPVVVTSTTTAVRGDLVARGQAVRERILKWIGISVGMGCGATKTLAKLANHVAKSADRKPGTTRRSSHGSAAWRRFRRSRRLVCSKRRRSATSGASGGASRLSSRRTGWSTPLRGARIFKPGFSYAKAGVMLLDLQVGDMEKASWTWTCLRPIG